MSTVRLPVLVALLAALLLAGCSSMGSGPERVKRETIVETALGQVGRPYRYGGDSPDGFDCSGLVAYVFGREGIALPRQTVAQYGAGRPVKPQDVRAGDLLFFATVSDGPSHVAIALDADTFVHAPSSRGVVRVERLALPYWSSRFLGARRVVD